MRDSYLPSYRGNRSRRSKHSTFLILFLLIVLIAGGWWVYSLLFAPNVDVSRDKEASIEIATGSDFAAVKESLYSKGYIIHRMNFELLARFKKYETSIKPGRYILKASMSNLELINKLRSGNQDPVKVVFNSVRYPENLAARIADQIEPDSVSLVRLMKDSVFLDSLGVTPISLFTMMIPNTYEIYWNTDARSFFKRMKKESDKFWNSKREKQLKALNLNKLQVITLASIVEKETNQNDEKARIAGVYLNRLRKGWLLEADPTLVFAQGNFEIRRVLNVYKQIDSPYNTYKYVGLPPGPICLPSVSSIDAVLDPETHNFMFFCAREDFSGYHNFAATIAQHNLNAWKYQQALNKKDILK